VQPFRRFSLINRLNNMAAVVEARTWNLDNDKSPSRPKRFSSCRMSTWTASGVKRFAKNASLAACRTKNALDPVATNCIVGVRRRGPRGDANARSRWRWLKRERLAGDSFLLFQTAASCKA
jgi:hypothetical protein